MNNEICNECGQSVKLGTGLFVNRIPDLNDVETRKQMGKLFPSGDYICVECESGRTEIQPLEAGKGGESQ